MRVSLEEVRRIASLSMLNFSNETAEALRRDLDDILEHAERLNQLDTEGVEPTTYILEQKNILRDDVQTQFWNRDDMLLNAPEKEDGCFVTPKVVD